MYANYGERAHRYENEYLTLDTPPSTSWMIDNDVPAVAQYGDRRVTSLNTGIGAMLGLDIVFRTGNGTINDKRNFILGFKYGIPNVGVDISDPLNVFTSPSDKVTMTFYHQALLKLGYCF